MSAVAASSVRGAMRALVASRRLDRTDASYDLCKSQPIVSALKSCSCGQTIP